MVDRIVPAATAASLDHAASLLGLRDEAAVSAEAFAQWVIEDDFAAGRPLWEAAGAELVRDVRPYQELKLRLLNGAHSAIAYLGALLGQAIRRRRHGRSGTRPLRRAADAGGDRAAHRGPPGLRCRGLRPGPPAAVREPLAAAPHAADRHGWLAEDPGALAAGAARGPAARRRRSRTWSRRSRFGSASSPAATRPAGTCRWTTRWRPACARSWRPNADDPAALVRAALAVEDVFGPDLRREHALQEQLTTALARIGRAGVRAALPR